MASDPFTELRLPPTLDLAAIKRAYFEALKRSPPHSDPEGFKRIRAAYEDLLEPKRRTTLVMSAPLDASSLEMMNARYKSAIGAARQNLGTDGDRGETNEKVDAFVKTFSVLPLPEAVAKAGAAN